MITTRKEVMISVSDINYLLQGVNLLSKLMLDIQEPYNLLLRVDGDLFPDKALDFQCEQDRRRFASIAVYLTHCIEVAECLLNDRDGTDEELLNYIENIKEKLNMIHHRGEELPGKI
jgi:hypothetical protein